MKEITIENLLLLKQPIIIDVRNNYDYNQGHINTAINIPHYNLTYNHHHYLNKYNTYYLYCDTGEKSKEVTKHLNYEGYIVINITGGYQAYKKLIQ